MHGRREEFVPAGFSFGLASDRGELRKAEGLFRRAVAARPMFAEAHLRLGRVLTLLGQPAPAAAELRDGIASTDDSLLLYYGHLFLGAAEEALRHFDGAYAAIMIGESDAGRALLIVFSDGLDTASWLSADAVLDAAKRSDVVAYGVSVRSNARPEFLRDLTSLTGGRLFEIEKTANLQATFLGILEEFRHRYLVSYTPRGVSKDGWHRLDVRVRRGGTVKARPGYLAGS